MRIKIISIVNFRSYYGTSTFDIGKGLTLIIGSNGDGKTTFYEALDWLFSTQGTRIEDLKLVSKKRISELLPGDSDDVSVSLTYEHDNEEHTLVKSFRFTKDIDEKISLSNPTFQLYKSVGFGKKIEAGIAIERDFPSEIRQFSMFKGETDLNVFRSHESLKLLVDAFSDIKDFDPYINFMNLAVHRATIAADKARSLDKKNESKSKELRSNINTLEHLISDMESELEQKNKSSVEIGLMLQSIEDKSEATELLETTQRRIDSLNTRKAEYYRDINDNYSIRLLDENWLLLGFGDIAKEYSAKVRKLDVAKRKLENDYQQELGARKLAKKIELGYVPLAVNVPDQNTMEELLEEEVCKVCGRPAPKGSEPWLFMKHKLEEFLESLNTERSGESESKFPRQYIEELANRNIWLNNNLANVTSTLHKIKEAIKKNEDCRREISRIEESLDEAWNQKTRILTGNEGLTESELISTGHNIKNLIRQKEKNDERIAVLKREIPIKKEERNQLVEKIRTISVNTDASTYERTGDALSLINDAFKQSKVQNKSNLITSIEDLSNKYLKLLNIGDFKGKIFIEQPSTDTAVAKLVDVDRMEVTNPNTALRTTQYMSILFGIAELSFEKNETEYPLIFDAPTSSFTEAKETEFFGILGKLEKQVIVVTKSFLKEIGNGESSLDLERLNRVNGLVYRIEKKRPFDDENLSTIQTVVSKIK